MAHGDGALDGGGRQLAACDFKVHMDAREHLGVGFGAIGPELDAAALHIVPAAAQNQHHIVGGTTAGTGEHRFHRAGARLAPLVAG